MLTLNHPTYEDLTMGSYVPVARRGKPKLRDPEAGQEGGMPEFMDNCCFHKKSRWSDWLGRWCDKFDHRDQLRQDSSGVVGCRYARS